MSYTVYIYNQTPKQGQEMSPEKLFTGSLSDKTKLKNAHPWGCPVYLLDPRLQGGNKIPKWDLGQDEDNLLACLRYMPAPLE